MAIKHEIYSVITVWRKEDGLEFLINTQDLDEYLENGYVREKPKNAEVKEQVKVEAPKPKAKKINKTVKIDIN